MTTTRAEAGLTEDGGEANDVHARRIETREHDFEIVSLDGLRDDGDAVQHALFESSDFFTPPPGEPDSLSLTVTVPHALQDIQHRAVERGDEI